MSEGPPPIKFGYVRVSTDDQRLELQTDALVKAGITGRTMHRWWGPKGTPKFGRKK